MYFYEMKFLTEYSTFMENKVRTSFIAIFPIVVIIILFAEGSCAS